MKCLSLTKEQKTLIRILRDFYFQPLLTKMLSNNQNLKRFWAQRKHPPDFQKAQAISMASSCRKKWKVLVRHLERGRRRLQRCFYRLMCSVLCKMPWSTTSKTNGSGSANLSRILNLHPEQEDPRQTADDVKYTPESQALSKEQVTQLNQLRRELQKMLGDKNTAQS